MKYITDTLDFSLERRSAVTLGKFDGLHRGHQKLVNRIREFGKDGFETVIFTFDVTPLALLGRRRCCSHLRRERSWRAIWGWTA